MTQPASQAPGLASDQPPRHSARRGVRMSTLLSTCVIVAVVAAAATFGGVEAFGGTGTPVSSSNTARATGSGWTAVAAKVEPSVVAVRVRSASGSGDLGSGVILDAKGDVLTNNHVVAAAAGGGSVQIALSDGRIYQASEVGADPTTDLAVIKLSATVSGLSPATFGDSSSVKVGQPVMAIGNPLGLTDTVTTGIVSALNRPVTTSAAQTPQGAGQPSGAASTKVITSAIQTDAAINPGNSGGALVDAGGDVVGITSSIASLDVSGSGQSGSIGLGFAIPSDEARTVANQLISTGSVQHAFLGVTIGDGVTQVSGAHRQAAIIRSVSPGTPAANAGLRANDAIVALNGKPLDGADALVAQIRGLPPGTAVTLSVVRGGKQMPVKVTLATRTGG